MPKIASIVHAALVIVYPVFIAGVGTARCQPSPGDNAVADALFQEGRKAMASGKIADACMKFADSNRIAPRLGTLLNLATCHEAQGKTASAWAEFVEATAASRQANQPERVAYAEQHARSLEG